MSESRCSPEDRMSSRYSVCLSLTSPNMRSSSTSEKPMMALSGVRSSCDMFARNSLLWRFATSSSRRLSSISRKRRAFWIASADWLAKVLSSSIAAGGKAPGDFRTIVSAPRIRSSRSRGTAKAARNTDRMLNSRRRPGYARPAGRRGSAPARDLPPLVPWRLPRVAVEPAPRRTPGRTQVKLLGGLVVLVDRAPVGPRKLVRAGDDGREHGFQVKRGADGLADVTEGAQLFDRARKLASRLEAPGRTARSRSRSRPDWRRSRAA